MRISDWSSDVCSTDLRWLNRILALRIATQNAIFEEYMGLIQARVDAAREAGTLDLGVEAIRAEHIVPISERVLKKDPVSGAETRLLRLELHLKRSEARRVGKECVSTCRSRWSAYL